MRQYKYNIGFPSDQIQFQGMKKLDDETFRVYAQRWIKIFSQVEPPLFEKELASVFMDTLQYPFYEKMVWVSSLIFSNLGTVGERSNGY